MYRLKLAAGGWCLGAFTYTEPAFEPGVVAPIPDGSQRGRRRRLQLPVLVLVLVLVLHLLPLLLWRAGRLQESVRPSAFSGGGGVELTLVSGAPGERSSEPAAPDGADLASTPQASPDAQAQNADVAEDGRPAPASADTPAASASPAPVGGGGADGQGVKASAGDGYDPWARSSLAPRTFQTAGAPGLWEKVKPCFTAQLPAQPIGFDVVIDSSGTFVDAYALPGPASQLAPAAYDEAVAQTTAALKSCGPYTGLNTNIAKRLRLNLPSAGEPG